MKPLPADVRRLVIAARQVAFDDARSRESLNELDGASEAFADRVPWDDEPHEEDHQMDDDGRNVMLAFIVGIILVVVAVVGFFLRDGASLP
jgi:hypothetical protein